MEDANKILSDAWVAKTDKEATEQADKKSKVKKWDKEALKKWQAAYLDTSLKAFKVVLDNAKETLEKVTDIRDQAKKHIENLEGIIAGLQKKNVALTDKQRDQVKEGEDYLGNTENWIKNLRDEYTKHCTFAGRANYYKTAADFGFIPKDTIAKINTIRKEGIDVGNEFGKSGPYVVRLDEYKKRWGILMKELSGLDKQRSGKVQDWAVDINKQLKEFTEGNNAWEASMRDAVTKSATKLNQLIGNMDNISEPKDFGPALLKAIKLKVSSKAKLKVAENMDALPMNLKLMNDFLKGAKGKLKTRVTEFKSLTESLKNAGPYAEPQRKSLAPLGTRLAQFDKMLDELAKQVGEAATAAKQLTA